MIFLPLFRQSVRLKPFTRFNCNLIRFSTKVPPAPTWLPVRDEDLPPETKISSDLVDHLERLALVDFSNQEGVERLGKAIRFADQILLVDATGVEPYDSVLEDRAQYLRADVVTEGKCRKEILSNAKKLVEEYYVAPPGNIPLAKKEKSYSKDNNEDH